jgi:hypothetical protein
LNDGCGKTNCPGMIDRGFTVLCSYFGLYKAIRSRILCVSDKWSSEYFGCIRGPCGCANVYCVLCVLLVLHYDYINSIPAHYYLH